MARLYAADRSPPEGFGEKIRAALGDRRPKAQSRERPRAGTRGRGPAPSPGTCPFPDPGVPHSALLPSRRVRPPPPLQKLGAASASAGPPRTAPPDRLFTPTRRVTPGRPWAPASGHAIRRPAPGTPQLGSAPAPPSAPGPRRCPSCCERPRRAFPARTRMGRGPWDHPERGSRVRLD